MQFRSPFAASAVSSRPSFYIFSSISFVFYCLNAFFFIFLRPSCPSFSSQSRSLPFCSQAVSLNMFYVLRRRMPNERCRANKGLCDNEPDHSDARSCDFSCSDLKFSCSDLFFFMLRLKHITVMPDREFFMLRHAYVMFRLSFFMSRLVPDHSDARLCFFRVRTCIFHAKTRIYHV